MSSWRFNLFFPAQQCTLRASATHVPIEVTLFKSVQNNQVRNRAEKLDEDGLNLFHHLPSVLLIPPEIPTVGDEPRGHRAD